MIDFLFLNALVVHLNARKQICRFLRGLSRTVEREILPRELAPPELLLKYQINNNLKFNRLTKTIVSAVTIFSFRQLAVIVLFIFSILIIFVSAFQNLFAVEYHKAKGHFASCHGQFNGFSFP
jgi:hypothetical protein